MKVIALMITARRSGDPRGFRRLGRWFPVGTPVRVALSDISPEQAEYLKTSDSRFLTVVEELDTPATDAAAPVASPKGRGK
jgi:hypothetical protein